MFPAFWGWRDRHPRHRVRSGLESDVDDGTLGEVVGFYDDVYTDDVPALDG